jgi:nucleoside-diphosphate-sugar epimerase
MPVSLVAGAAGFLGSNLSTKLLKEGHTVIGLDNLSTSTGQNLKALLEHKDFHFAEGSVSDQESLPKIKALDFIFHMASPASPPKDLELGYETIQANTAGTQNLINLALATGSRMVFASTSEIYGDPQVTPQSEDYWGNVNPIGPRSIYDESKRMGETLISFFKRERGLDAGIIRIFNTYGPGMDPEDGRVVSSFISQALKGKPFTIFGDGSQTRSFCYVDDLTSGIISMAESREFGPINLGNPTELDLISFGKLVASVLDVEPTFEFSELPTDDPKQRRPDIGRARELLGWEPVVGIEEGIKLTAAWMTQDSSGLLDRETL